MTPDYRPLSARIVLVVRYVGIRLVTCVVLLATWGCAGPRPMADDGAGRLNPWGQTSRTPRVETTDRPDSTARVAGPDLPAMQVSAHATQGADGPGEGEIASATETVTGAESDEPEEPGTDDEGASAPTAPAYSACVAPLDATEPQYVLPYAVGDEFPVRQGTCGPVTHRGAFSYAYDFEMPRGTPILAARGGIVTSIVENLPENTNRSSHANYVVLKHDDGQFSRYLHLQTEGVAVAVGDTVLAGDLIAYSGNSGRSSRPHLHFDVTNGCGRVSSRCPTLPVTFMNADDKALRGGRTYPALVY